MTPLVLGRGGPLGSFPLHRHVRRRFVLSRDNSVMTLSSVVEEIGVHTGLGFVSVRRSLV